jgi:hypothetical protein
MANTTGKKFGGREKGTPNKLTKDLRNVLKELVYYELESLVEKLEKIEPKERIELVIKLLPYTLPKLQNISYTTNEPIDWEV